MARIRTIKPDFWEDEKIGKLPIPCRLFFIGCWNFADDIGVIKGNAALLKSQIFPYDENLRVSEIKKWIDALVDARMLVPIIHAEESYYYIRTFRSHQVLDKRYNKSYINKNIVNDLINRALRDNGVDTTSTLRDNGVDTTMEKEKEKEKKESTNVDKKDAAFAATLSRKENFRQSLVPFVEKYGKDMMRDFFDYWSEMNKSCTKMRFEQQPAWEVAKRLATWASRDKTYENNRRNYTSKQDANDYAMQQYLLERERVVQGVHDETPKPF